jgi:hypothetical protein
MSNRQTKPDGSPERISIHSASVFIKDVHLKTTMSYFYTFPGCLELPCSVGSNVTEGHFGKLLLQDVVKLNIRAPCAL